MARSAFQAPPAALGHGRLVIVLDLDAVLDDPATIGPPMTAADDVVAGPSQVIGGPEQLATSARPQSAAAVAG